MRPVGGTSPRKTGLELLGKRRIPFERPSEHEPGLGLTTEGHGGSRGGPQRFVHPHSARLRAFLRETPRLRLSPVGRPRFMGSGLSLSAVPSEHEPCRREVSGSRRQPLQQDGLWRRSMSVGNLNCGY